MPFLIFAVLGFIVLGLTIRAPLRTLLVLAVLIGLLGDFGVDLLIAIGR
jgi:hypothetical protein